jgi:hypothetical protein
MRRGSDSRNGRRAWLAGRIAVLLAIVLAGTLAIVRYSSVGQALAGRPDPSSVQARATARNLPAQSSTPASSPSATASRAAVAAATSSPSPTARHSQPVPSPSPTLTSTARPGIAPVHFRTLPPGAKLPTGAECARWVRKTPLRENKAANKRYNHTIGQHVGAHFFAAGDSPQANRLLAPRINGDFTGTTKEILRWASCKWGISQYVVFAQAAVESWWQQDTLGDWGTDAAACPPGHKLGADGRPGQCPQSYGILQNRYPYEPASWPGIGKSTAMNADTAYAIWRSCYDGYEVWLNNVPHGRPYHKGDMWGCVGRWFAGRWHTAPAQQYIAKVKQYLREKIWLTKDFQQG